MARRELRRKITATVLTVTALCCLLGVCAWLLLGSNVFSDTIRIMMLVCTVVLGVATIGLLVAKVQEIRALREIIRSEDAQQQSEAETPRPELAPLQTLDHTTIELPPLPDIPAFYLKACRPDSRPCLAALDSTPLPVAPLPLGLGLGLLHAAEIAIFTALRQIRSTFSAFHLAFVKRSCYDKRVDYSLGRTWLFSTPPPPSRTRRRLFCVQNGHIN